jgi:hypothetical protein
VAFTKPKGDHAKFQTTCHRCQGELTITNGRVDHHDCREPRPVTLEQIRAALDNR